MIYALHIGHDPRPGATADPDGPGPLPETSEVDITRPLIEAIHRLCGGLIDIIEPVGKTSSERRKSIAATGLDCISIELHLDAGKGRVAHAFYAPWSKMGRMVARSLAESISDAPIPWDCLPIEAGKETYPRVLDALAWTYTSRPAGVILELGFIDRAEHVAFFANPANVEIMAEAILRGIDVDPK